jgi:Xaa-Pro aminopeptidase
MAHAPTETLDRRLDLVRRAIAAQSLDGLAVTALPNVLYLTNFTGTSAIAVVTAERVLFLTDSRYITVVEETRGTPHECPGLELVRVEGAYDLALSRALAAMPSARIGFESAHLSVQRHAGLQARAATAGGGPELVATEGIVEHVRVVKDAYELMLLREAGARLSDVATRILSTLRPGSSESEAALQIDWEVRQAGFERAAFETIVASGPNAALPHARPTERKFVEGDLVVLDFGGVYDSYCVDLTRTVSVGAATERARQVYQAVLEAHDEAVAAVRPGVSRFDVDAAARGVLGRAGFAAAFGHGTGHGLGVEVHEDPRITERRPDVDAREEAIVEGMVFTIEPGAYFAGWGGVRIEDDVAVTASGVEVLTNATTDLVEI